MGDENYCDWRQSECKTVATLRAENERLTRERDDERASAEAAERKVKRLREALETYLKTDCDFEPICRAALAETATENGSEFNM